MKQQSPTDSILSQSEQANSAAPAVADTSVQVPATSGMQGEPLPYKLESDEAVVGSLTLCFVLILLALQRGSQSIIPYLKEALTIRHRNSFFEEKASISSISSVALCTSTILTSGICLYKHYATSTFPQEFNHLLILSAYTMAFAILILGKSLLYNFVNWVFFSREKIHLWEQSYWGLIAAAGVVLFPSVLYIVFLDTEIQISSYLLLTILAIFKILLFYKLIGNFFAHFYGVSHLILYFCALELIPDLLLWKGVEIFNNVFLKL